MQSNGLIIFKGEATGIAQDLPQEIRNSTALMDGATTGYSVIDGEAGSHATGAIGFNSAAGIGNVQANMIVIEHGNSTNFEPTSNISQSSHDLSVTMDGGSHDAHVAGNAFESASGIISVNSTSGAFNQQANVTLLTSNALGAITPSLNQYGIANTFTSNATLNSSIGGNAFSGASGQIGVNVSAGAGNLQANQLIISKP